MTITATVYVDGTTISGSVIASKLYNLYSGGATPGLMTGVAMTESSYNHFQFTDPKSYCYQQNSTLFGQTGLWPNAGCSDGGRTSG